MAILPDKYIITSWYVCMDGENQNESRQQLHGVSKRNDYHSHDNPNGLLIVILGAGRYQDAYRWRGLRSNEDFPATRISQHEVSTSLNSKWYVTESTRKVKKKQSWPRKSSNSVPNPIALESAFSRDKASAKGRIPLPNRMIFFKSAKGNEKRNDYHSHEYGSGELILTGCGPLSRRFSLSWLEKQQGFPRLLYYFINMATKCKEKPKGAAGKVHQENNSNSADADPDDSTYISTWFPIHLQSNRQLFITVSLPRHEHIKVHKWSEFLPIWKMMKEMLHIFVWSVTVLSLGKQ